jgi:hypothetical protein
LQFDKPLAVAVTVVDGGAGFGDIVRVIEPEHAGIVVVVEVVVLVEVVEVVVEVVLVVEVVVVIRQQQPIEHELLQVPPKFIQSVTPIQSCP